MIKKLKLPSTILSLFLASAVQADSILVYEKTGADGNSIVHTFSITGRWLRIDSDTKGKPDYMLMDTGRQILFEVDDSTKSYKQTRMNKAYWPEVTIPKLKPVQEKTTVSGIRCQKVREMGPENPVAEHCMATGGPLGLNPRKTKTLSRLFMVARRMGWDWPSVATPDERQVSIQSRNSGTGISQNFKSVEHKGIPDNLFKIPDDYKRITVAQKELVRGKPAAKTEKKSKTAAETAKDTGSANTPKTE